MPKSSVMNLSKKSLLILLVMLFCVSCKESEQVKFNLAKVNGFEFSTSQLQEVGGNISVSGTHRERFAWICHKDSRGYYNLYGSSKFLAKGELTRFKRTKDLKDKNIICSDNNGAVKINDFSLEEANVKKIQRSLGINGGAHEGCEYWPLGPKFQIQTRVDCILSNDFDSCCEGKLKAIYVRCNRLSYIVEKNDLQVDLVFEEGLLCK